MTTRHLSLNVLQLEKKCTRYSAHQWTMARIRYILAIKRQRKQKQLRNKSNRNDVLTVLFGKGELFNVEYRTTF